MLNDVKPVPPDPNRRQPAGGGGGGGGQDVQRDPGVVPVGPKQSSRYGNTTTTGGANADAGTSTTAPVNPQTGGVRDVPPRNTKLRDPLLDAAARRGGVPDVDTYDTPIHRNTSAPYAIAALAVLVFLLGLTVILMWPDSPPERDPNGPLRPIDRNRMLQEADGE